MKIVHKTAEIKSYLRSLQSQGLSIGFVPTMGALHEGHLSLARRAKKENAVSVMSIYVNPAQFAPNEDFDQYPRNLDRDCELAVREKVDFIFAPDKNEIYAPDFSTFIEETSLSKVLCGAFRPGHFRGVCTVVFRLLQIVSPDRAYFGMKDGQQLRVVEKMVGDLRLETKVIPCATFREKDGLAMSSRNAYLSEEERSIAPVIYQVLSETKAAFDGKERSSRTLLSIASERLSKQPLIQVQYLELRKWHDFAEGENVTEKSILALAAYLGKTRLIDNVILDPAK